MRIDCAGRLVWNVIEFWCDCQLTDIVSEDKYSKWKIENDIADVICVLQSLGLLVILGYFYC